MMDKVIKGVLAGVGTGSKVHLSGAIVDGKKMSVFPAECGAVKSRGWSMSFTRGMILSDESLPYTEESEANPSAGYDNYMTSLKAQRFMVAELLKQPNACSKCVKRAERLFTGVAA